MQRAAQDWIVYTELTRNDATAVGFVMALQFGPALLLLPLTGYAADRFDRRRLLMLTQTLQGALALLHRRGPGYAHCLRDREEAGAGAPGAAARLARRQPIRLGVDRHRCEPVPPHRLHAEHHVVLRNTDDCFARDVADILRVLPRG